VIRRSTPAAAAAAVVLSLVSCGGGDGPSQVDNACGFRDGEPNGGANQATQVDVGATFDGCLEGGDVDFLAIQSPDDEIGGYVLVTVAGATGVVRATIYDDAGQVELGSFVADAPGAGLSFYWASGSAQQTRFAVRDEGGAGLPYAYQLTAAYTPVADAFEPNNDMAAAAVMPEGGQMSAYLFAGRHDAANDPAAYDDHYRFTAQPGALSITLNDVPGNVAGRLFLFRSDGSEVARVSSGLRGGALTMNVPMVAAEELIVRVSLWAEAPAAVGAGTELPASFTQPYRLNVSQTGP
jgi:hypothetical protein